jgi:hypothetical protein
VAQLKYHPGGGGSSGSEQFEWPDWVGEGATLSEGVAFVVTGGGWHVWHTTMICVIVPASRQTSATQGIVNQLCPLAHEPATVNPKAVLPPWAGGGQTCLSVGT